MFNIYGTFTIGQFNIFKAFTKVQAKDLILRQRWLRMEMFRVGIFSTEYDDDEPVSFQVLPIDSYGAKLVAAYHMLGGKIERDMLLRTRDKPVFLKKAGEMRLDKDGMVIGGYSEEYTNGRIDRGSQIYDRDVGMKIERLKYWQLEAIKLKRERLEYKIKRALDYSDQLSEEVKLIDDLLGTGRQSIENQIVYIYSDIYNPLKPTTAFNTDPYGLKIGPYKDPIDPSHRDDNEYERG